MLKPYHIEICRRALDSTFSPKALKIIIAANLAQDSLRGLVGHPEYHFDNNAFEAGLVYMEAQRQIILDTISMSSELKMGLWESPWKRGYKEIFLWFHHKNIPLSSPSSGNSQRAIKIAWEAFGKLTHAAQDFYAHSNYISLWVRTHRQTELPPPAKVKALQSEILNHPDFCSGKVYLWDWLAFVPGLHGLAQRLLPLDSHTHMNLDSPNQGPMFPYAYQAAVKRTILEYEQIIQGFDKTSLTRFKGY